MEILFLLEILINFITSYTNKETFEKVYSIKLIAQHYIQDYHFFLHVLAVFPFWLVISDDVEIDPEQ